MTASAKPGKLPPEVLAFYEQKRARPSFHYQDTWAEEHSAAFTVAGLMEQDLVDFMRQEVKYALENGLPYEKFAKNITPTLQRAGWWGKRVEVADESGATRTTRVDPARLRLIIQTNTRTARAAGQWQRIQRSKAVLPFLRYRQGTAARHRPDHEAIANRPTILPVEHPFWDYAMPQNGWGCVCWVEQITQGARAQLPESPEPDLTPIEVKNTRTGKTMTTIRGIDPMFAYNPGKDRLRGLELAGGKPKRTKKTAPPPAAPERAPSTRLGDMAARVFGRRLSDEELDDLSGLRAELPPGIRLSIEEIKETSRNRQNEEQVRLHGVFYDDANPIDGRPRRIGALDRTYVRAGQETHVKHEYFQISDEYQNSGIGRRVFNAQVDAYQKHGIARVKLEAADVGRYVWTKAGFEWTNPAQLAEIRTQLRAHLAGRFGDAAADAMMPALQTPDEIAGLTVEGERVGKTFLLSFGWDGDFIEMSQVPSKIRRL